MHIPGRNDNGVPRYRDAAGKCPNKNHQGHSDCGNRTSACIRAKTIMPIKDLQKRSAYGRGYRARKRSTITVQKAKRRTYVRISNPAVRMHKDAKARAKKRAIPFNIEVSDINVPLCCPLLGVLFTHGPTKKKRSPSPFAPSLDRIRPELGYVKGNVRVISHLANTMKNAATPEQLYRFALNILREHAGRMF
jgi:hypothetical protein